MTFSKCLIPLLCMSLFTHWGATPAAAQTRPPAQAAANTPLVATASVELTDPAGDVQPIIYRESVGDGPEK